VAEGTAVAGYYQVDPARINGYFVPVRHVNQLSVTVYFGPEIAYVRQGIFRAEGAFPSGEKIAPNFIKRRNREPCFSLPGIIVTGIRKGKLLLRFCRSFARKALRFRRGRGRAGDRQ
jgi:hypothetical protein